MLQRALRRRVKQKRWQKNANGKLVWIKLSFSTNYIHLFSINFPPFTILNILLCETTLYNSLNEKVYIKRILFELNTR